jgi:hypothetical protein
MKHLYYRLFCAVLALVAFPTTQAETVNCTPISSLPYAITIQGVYCLKDNLSTAIASGSAISIETNNVVIDLNGYKLGGAGAGISTSAKGISATSRSNITIRNGIIRGFHYGISLTGGSGDLIENMLLDLNTGGGVISEKGATSI